jgi:hypothetical protein
MRAERPEQDEAGAYYFTYIDQVPDGDILERLEIQAREVPDILSAISEDASRHRYAEDKWSIRDVLAHVNDTERVFSFRAFWFARALDRDLPGFEQDAAALAAGADARSWSGHIEEFRAVRQATLTLFGNLPAEAWSRRGIADGKPFTVRSLAWITAGHVAHHLRVLRERYL